MAYQLSATFVQEQAKSAGAEPINLYVLNASRTGTDYLYYANYNQNIYGFALDENGIPTNATQLYTGVPITMDALTTETSGAITEINLGISNTNRVVESYIQNQDYLRGREVYFITTFATSLPSGNSAFHIGTAPDKNAMMKEKFFVDTTTSNEEQVTFSCKPKFSIKKVVVPGRTFARECHWALRAKYAATECDPLGSINTVTFPTCDGSLDNCRERLNVKRYGGFPSIPRRGITIL